MEGLLGPAGCALVSGRSVASLGLLIPVRRGESEVSGLVETWRGDEEIAFCGNDVSSSEALSVQLVSARGRASPFAGHK